MLDLLDNGSIDWGVLGNSLCGALLREFDHLGGQTYVLGTLCDLTISADASAVPEGSCACQHGAQDQPRVHRFTPGV